MSLNKIRTHSFKRFWAILQNGLPEGRQVGEDTFIFLQELEI